MTKNLKGTDKILNLKEINIMEIDSQSSSTCSGKVFFSIDCETEKGHCEDPDFTGTMKVLDVKKNDKEPNAYTLKIKLVQDKKDNEWDLSINKYRKEKQQEEVVYRDSKEIIKEAKKEIKELLE